MKKVLFTSALLIASIAMMAQKPVLTFSETTHDFGKINEADGRVSTIFEFKNEGMEPLVLSNVRASCGCTTPSWTKEPVEPGETGAITVTYNPNGRPGQFQKTITVQSNAEEGTKKLFIKGEVIPKPAKPVNKYPIKMGELNVNTNKVQFGDVLKGKDLVKTIEYANHTEKDITVDLLIKDGDSFLLTDLAPLTIKKGESGAISIKFLSNKCNTWGPVATDIYVVVNGQKQMTDEFRVDITATVVEDFSQMTAEQIQNAPILDIPNQFELGTVAAGAKLVKNITLKNSGAKDALVIRRIVNNAKNMTINAKKSVKAGKTLPIKIEINTVENGKTLAPGKYTREITLITNDPKQSTQKIKINWVIE